jgi:lipoprotein-anchoring transpeptidase ErfK/SrfK
MNNAPCQGTGGGLIAARRRAGRLAVALVVAVAIATPSAQAAVGKGSSVVAEASGRGVAVFRKPGARKPFTTFANPTPHGARLVFLVKQRRRGWEQVYLPTRPNGSTGWIRDDQVTLASNPYRIDISLGRHTLTLYKGERVIHREPAGVGRSVTATPTGTYYIVELLAQTNPAGAYGPYAFGLSAHSNVLYSFGGGPGQIGLHGTNEPGRLGTDVSHGCIRISNAGITRLAKVLPLGTPVRIAR